MEEQNNDRKALLTRAIEFLRGRKLAYIFVFNKESRYVHEVLSDLSKFCRAVEPTFHADERIHARLEGRREVFLRITEHLNLTPEELYNLYSKGQLK